MLGMGSTPPLAAADDDEVPPPPPPAEEDDRLLSLATSAKSVRKLSMVSVQILSMMEREDRADRMLASASVLALVLASDSTILDSILRVDSRGVRRSRAMHAIC